MLGSNISTSGGTMTISLSDNMLNYRGIKLYFYWVIATNNFRISSMEIEHDFIEELLTLTSYSYWLSMNCFFSTSTNIAANFKVTANNQIQMMEKSVTATHVMLKVYGVK